MIKLVNKLVDVKNLKKKLFLILSGKAFDLAVTKY